jgi:hypothetical protein
MTHEATQIVPLGCDAEVLRELLDRIADQGMPTLNRTSRRKAERKMAATRRARRLMAASTRGRRRSRGAPDG